MSPSPGLALFVGGAMSAGYALAGLFFLRFWTRTRDSLFGAFAIAFCLMAANQAVTAFARHENAETGLAYLLRLSAFVLIIVAVLGKNRRGAP